VLDPAILYSASVAAGERRTVRRLPDNLSSRINFYMFMKKKKTVVIGFVGTKLDNYRGQSRWDKWRPTIALTQHQDLEIARFELLYNGPFDKLVEQVAADIGSVSPDTQVLPHALELRDARSACS
jgi:hypothetical protein